MSNINSIQHWKKIWFDLTLFPAVKPELKRRNSQLSQAFKTVLKFNDSPSVCIKMIRRGNLMRLFCSRARAVERCRDNSWCSLCERLPAGYIDQFRSSAFSSQRTGFVMNNTYPVTGGSPQRCDPTGSMPLTCCAVWALEKQRKKKKCVRQVFFFSPN